MEDEFELELDVRKGKYFNLSTINLLGLSSVADPGCLSLILIFVHPGSRISDPRSQIPYLKTASKEMGEKICCPTFFCSQKYQKLINYFIFELLTKNNLG
jgi:hypothetical protein